MATKRPNPFSIESILAAPTAGRNSSNNNNDPLRRYIRRLNLYSAYNKKYTLSKWKSSFLIEQLPADPQQMLRRLFQRCLQDGMSEAQRNGVTADKLGIEVYSRLLDPEIFLHFHLYSPNSVDTILNRFLEVSQSKSHIGSLWGEPFTVCVTSIASNTLPKRLQLRGSGARRQQKCKLRHQISNRMMLPVRNADTHCLFYAMLLSKKHSLKEPNFKYYLHHRHQQQQQDVQQMMLRCGVPIGMVDYDATIWAPRVIDFWNATHAALGQKFKVFIFKRPKHWDGKLWEIKDYYHNCWHSDTFFPLQLFIFGPRGEWKPEFRYGPDEFTVPICIYHDNNHFDGIRTRCLGQALFDRDYYCFSCETPVANPHSHTRQCRSLCLMCGRLGRQSGGCPPNENLLPLRCVHCCKVFRNADCFQYHHTGGECSRTRQCERCGVIW